MAFFLTILEGNDPDDAKPLLASRDERLIGAVASEIAKRFSVSSGSTKKKLVSIDRKLRRQAPPILESSEG